MRCDVVLLGWTAFISFNLATEYFWTSAGSTTEDDKQGFTSAMSSSDVYTGTYTISSNGSFREEGRLRMVLGTQATAMKSVEMSAATISLSPKESSHRYYTLQPHLYFSGLEMQSQGRHFASGASDPRKFKGFGEKSCQLDAAFDSNEGTETWNGLHMEADESVSMSGEVHAMDCGYRLSFKSSLVNIIAFSQKVVRYSVWLNLLSIFQIRCFLHQIRVDDDSPAISKVSMACIALQAMSDAYESFLHICLGLSSQYMFNSMAVIALFKFLLFSFLEARYLLIILKHRRPQVFSEGWEAVRAEVSSLYARFYGVLVLGLMLLYRNLDKLNLFTLFLQAYWIPQIAWSAWIGTRPALTRHFILGISFSRLMLPLYVWGCPVNIFSGELYPRLSTAPSVGYCCILVSFQVVQVTVLLLQEKLGPRWFIPWVCMPWAYNYHSFQAIDAGTDCVICMTELDPEDGKRVVTPCSHHFHEACLREWMEVKMECPTCRTEIPPIE